MHEPDPELVAAARSGDTAAFERLIRRYQPEVWRLAFHVLHDRTGADDATQEAFVRAWRHLRRFRGASKFSTWMFSIARNAAIDELRRVQRHERIEETLRRRRSTEQSETGGEVHDAIASLPIELREVIVFVDLLGFNYSDTARACRIPEGTVKSRVHRGRKELLGLIRSQREEATGEI